MKSAGLWQVQGEDVIQRYGKTALTMGFSLQGGGHDGAE